MTKTCMSCAERLRKAVDLMRKLITMMLFGGGALTIISFGDGIAEKILLAGCIVCVCIASGLEITGD